VTLERKEIEMKKNCWIKVIGLVFFVLASWGFAGDDNPKLENVIIQELDAEAMTLTVNDMNFWVDAKTKMEDDDSNPISLSDFSVGDTIEIWYNDSQTNDDGFIYASKIEFDN
jgi:Domain of unknown function (DUF5666)